VISAYLDSDCLALGHSALRYLRRNRRGGPPGAPDNTVLKSANRRI